MLAVVVLELTTVELLALVVLVAAALLALEEQVIPAQQELQILVVAVALLQIMEVLLVLQVLAVLESLFCLTPSHRRPFLRLNHQLSGFVLLV
jgi:hypothetical protein